MATYDRQYTYDNNHNKGSDLIVGVSNAHGEGGERTKNPDGENYHLEVSKNNYDQDKQYDKDDDDDAIC